MADRELKISIYDGPECPHCREYRFEDVTHPSQIGARDQRPFPPHGCHGKLEFCRNLGHCSRGEHGQCDAGELCPSELWQPSQTAATAQ